MLKDLNAILNKVVNWKDSNHPDIDKIMVKIHALNMETEPRLDGAVGVFFERVI